MSVSIKQDAQKAMTDSLAKSGLLMDMHANYLEKVCEAVQESKHPAFENNVRIPNNSAQELAKELVMHYIAEHKMFHTEKTILNETNQQFSPKQEKNETARKLRIRNPSDLVHQIVTLWKKSERKQSLRPSPEENSAVHTMISDTFSTAEQEAVVSRNAKIPEEDFTIGSGKHTTTAATDDEPKNPWKIPPKKPVRSKPHEMKYARPAAQQMQEQALTKTETHAAETTTSTTQDDFTPTPPEPEPKKKTKKVARKRPRKAKVQLPDEAVQVTLSITDTKSTEPPTPKNSITPSYTNTYGTQQTPPITQYTYTYEEITIPRGEHTGESRDNTIPTTDTFDHQLVKEKPHRTSTASHASTKSRTSYASKKSTHSRHSTVEFGDKPKSSDANSRKSTNNTTKSSDVNSRKSANNTTTKTSDASSRKSANNTTTGEYSTASSTRKKKVPPPSLPQPGTQTGSNSNNQSYSQDTFNRRAKVSPLGEFLNDDNNQLPSKSVLQNDNTSTPTGVSINILSAGKSDTTSTSKKSSVASVPKSPKSYSEQSYTDYGLNSDELGDVQLSSDKFKSDAVSDEKMASDEKLWSRNRQ